MHNPILCERAHLRPWLQESSESGASRNHASHGKSGQIASRVADPASNTATYAAVSRHARTASDPAAKAAVHPTVNPYNYALPYAWTDASNDAVHSPIKGVEHRQHHCQHHRQCARRAHCQIQRQATHAMNRLDRGSGKYWLVSYDTPWWHMWRLIPYQICYTTVIGIGCHTAMHGLSGVCEQTLLRAKATMRVYANIKVRNAIGCKAWRHATIRTEQPMYGSA